MAGPVTRWFFAPVPLRRIAVFRALVYLFVPIDMFLFTGSTWGHVHSAANYRPVLIARLLHLPAANEVSVPVLFGVVLVACLVAAAGRLPRVAGYTAALGFGYWAILAMSYGKVDHDHLALMVALFVLPTIGHVGGSRTAQPGTPDTAKAEAAGWAVRCVQIAVVATYFLSTYAKIRFGGWEWPNGATFHWAMSRRGTPVGQFLADFPTLLHLSQWGVLIAELLSPVLLFLRGRALHAGVVFFLGFHLMTWVTIAIHFLPLVVCLLVFLPLERVRLRAAIGRKGAGGGAAGQKVAVVGDQAVDPVS
ncbi:HTTM domain-containing protein [Sinosporangium siamense]|uniref:HTTM-like domain-containing protein n=1 Tax=Sinosporangium siamense TaxID=1367973 RepID=A0A919RJ11_9ACTN|nr:HTTM domain-containing protein [Sinosporangium siamense]GII92769.1 hypothetical protein Ssi02_30000 [Sinosporangium siamense]